ncbi:hypothetical protein [Paracoccus onubensis]|uniref:hypothetical protein n=1 Tax=Paracoccus onubensis TaxID=1675788 RepID=UPI0011C48F64|nr:hypothetical protein [Paracoccus onubensis]
MHRARGWRHNNVEPDRLRQILCRHDERLVSRQLAMSYEKKRIILEPNELSPGAAGKYVDLCEFADESLKIAKDGIPLPYTMFDKEPRVTHAAITENKRLGGNCRQQNDRKESTPGN